VSRVVVADTSPILYLHLIEQIDILHALFGTILLPSAVHRELCHPAAPRTLRAWTLGMPSWISVVATEGQADPETALLDGGEREAIALAEQVHADLVLMDERKGVRISLRKGLRVIGTPGVLDLAARRGLIDLAASLDRLKATNFRYRAEMLNRLLAQHQAGLR
jgi:predicted nucleic acid-binding protein